MPASDKPLLAIDRALEVFAHGFCFTRSFTHPFVPTFKGNIWTVRDGPRKSGSYRREEWITHRATPAEMDKAVRQRGRGSYIICALAATGEDVAALRDAYKAMGYRLGATEPLMVNAIRRVPRFTSPATVQRVKSEDLAGRLAKAAKARQILPEHLAGDAPLRQYVAIVDDTIVGWVRSVTVGDATWCADMYVKPQFRRQGIARSLLCQMLRDDRKHGSTAAVLLASHTGAKLYPSVGYEPLGTLLCLMPPKV